MITKAEIKQTIDKTLKEYNAPLADYNAHVKKNNEGKTYKDPGYLYHKRELKFSDYNGNSPEVIFHSELDFGVLEFKQVDDFGGEGQGDHCHEVYKVMNRETGETVHIKFDGWYNSNEGTNYSGDFDMVEPYEKTVTAWRKI